MNINRISGADQEIAGVSTQRAKAAASPAAAVATVESVTAAQSAPVDPVALRQAVQAINTFLKPVASGIEFSVDEGSGKNLVKVIDLENNEVLMQFPSKEALVFGRELDKLQGNLIRDKA